MPPCPSSPWLLSALRTGYHIPCPEVSRSMTTYKSVCPAMRFWVCPLMPLSSVFVQHGNCKLYPLLTLAGTTPDFQTQSSWKHWHTATAVRDTDWTAQASHRGCWSGQGQHWQMPPCSLSLSQQPVHKQHQGSHKD